MWILAGLSVLMLTVGRQATAGALYPVEIIDDATSSCLLVLWILTPLTYARDTASAIGSCIEAAITVVISLVVLKITMIVTAFVTSTFWSAIGWVVPFAIPDWIRVPFDALASIAAELFFFTLILGYTWTKARDHFGRWATVRVEQPKPA